jgi:CRISPR system Cascade subunit CasE
VTTSLYLVRLILDRRAVLRIGARHRLGAAADEGALLHAGLSELFATSSDPAMVPLHVFAVDDLRAASARQPDSLFLLAYADADGGGLVAAMGPKRAEVVRRCETREMPAFAVGQRLGFRTRVCPIVRTRRPGERPLRVNRQGKVKHREIDAFLHATLTARDDSNVDREDVYRQWLRKELCRDGASTLNAAHLAEFRRELMRRHGGARIERPNAVLEGHLTVSDPLAFRALLVRGVGRHRAFGFGMLLLRPPGTSTC